MAKWVGVWLVVVLVAASVTYAADVTVNGYVQYQYFTQQTTGQKGAIANNFLFKAARLKGSLKINDKISAMVYLDGTKQPSVLEANVEYAFAPIAVARFGQFQVPFGYESQNANFDNEAIDRSQIVSNLWYNGATLGYFRDAGVMLMGQRQFLSYKVACVNGSGLNVADNNNHKDIVGRIGLGIPMFAGIGVSALRGAWPDSAAAKNVDRNAVGFDLYLDTGKVLVEGEYIRGDGLVGKGTGVYHIADVNYSGYYALVGYRVTPMIEPVFKYDRYNPNTDKDDMLTNIYMGVALNFEGKARLKTFYVVKQEPSPKIDNNVFMMQVEAKF
jgi:hypothetical protein